MDAKGDVFSQAYYYNLKCLIKRQMVESTVEQCQYRPALLINLQTYKASKHGKWKFYLDLYNIS